MEEAAVSQKRSRIEMRVVSGEPCSAAGGECSAEQEKQQGSIGEKAAVFRK